MEVAKERKGGGGEVTLYTKSDCTFVHEEPNELNGWRHNWLLTFPTGVFWKDIKVLFFGGHNTYFNTHPGFWGMKTNTGTFRWYLRNTYYGEIALDDNATELRLDGYDSHDVLDIVNITV